MADRMRLRALAPAAVAAIALTACWPVPGGNADRTAHNPFETAFTTSSVADLEPAWTAELGPGASGPVVIDHSGVFVRVDRSVSRLDVRTGATAWTWRPPAEVADLASVGEPIVVGDRLYLGYGFGNAGGQWSGVAIDPVTGDELAVRRASGLLQTARGSLVAGVVASFGSLTPVAVSYTLIDVSAATSVHGGTLSIESSGGAARPGLTIGERGVYQTGNGLVGGQPDPVLGHAVRRFPFEPAGNCGPSGAPFFACPDWATPLTATTPVVIGPGEQTLYVGVADGSVAALDAATGGVLWTAAVGASPTGAPALAGGVLYVPTADGDLVAVDAGGCGAAVCEPLWSTAVDGTAVTVQPAVAGDGDEAVVFVGTQGGTVAAVAAGGCGAPTCPVRWQASVGAAITGAPAVSNGKLVVGTADGRIAAFRLP